ncbi:DNA-binding MarR family transcriptional regulator [Sphaerotilus mobilis]|uniref:DNA-binding MarR family transcriptional regulator n=1 Tax=Sphaerotilus mobilis TaxID=47994 RepID=A0A4Q7LE30_9BURK|nr:DNA-binding MarR family transcriptional regulator [Sphaerotilus mobilis]
MLTGPATQDAAPGMAAPALHDVPDVPSTKKSHPHRRGLAEGALADILGYRVVQAQIATHALFMQHVGDPMDLRPVEYTLLQMLRSNTQVTPKQLAQSLVLTAPKLTILLDRLQERGLITRVRSDTDGRSQHVLLTDDGAELAQRGSEQAVLLEMSLQDVLTPGERAILMELLQKVADSRRG